MNFEHLEYLHFSESELTQSCLTLCDPMDCSLPGSSIHGILQARILEWGAISFSRGSSQPRDGTWVCRTADRPALYLLSHREARCLHFACVKRSDDSSAPSLRPPRHRCALTGRPQPRRPPVCTSLCPAVTFSAAGACSVWCLTCVPGVSGCLLRSGLTASNHLRGAFLTVLPGEAPGESPSSPVPWFPCLNGMKQPEFK